MTFPAPTLNTQQLQKRTRQVDGSGKLAYTARTGLDLGTPYSPKDYPTGTNPGTKQPWAPATDGLRTVNRPIQPRRLRHALRGHLHDQQ